MWRALVAIVSTSHPRASSGAPGALHEPTGSNSRSLRNRKLGVLGQRYEFRLTRNRGEAPGLPLRRGRVDALLAARDEIPPDKARSIERLAAQQHHARIVKPRHDWLR